jgi:hypothetical protein
LRFARFVLAASALAFAGIGLGFFLWPEAFAGRVGIAPHGPAAYSDLRAVFGGLELGLAGFLAWSAAAPERLRLALVAQLAAFGGLVAGRAWSLAADGAPGAFSLGLLGAEVVALVCGGIALRGLPERP